MALGRNNKKDTLPSVYDIRLLDGKSPMGIMQNGRKMLKNRLKHLKFALLQRILMTANVI